MQQLLPLDVWKGITEYSTVATLSRLRLVTRGATAMWQNPFEPCKVASLEEFDTIKVNKYAHVSLPFVNALLNLSRAINALPLPNGQAPSTRCHMVKFDPSLLGHHTEFFLLVAQTYWVPEPLCVIHKPTGIMLHHPAIIEMARYHCGRYFNPFECYVFRYHCTKKERVLASNNDASSSSIAAVPPNNAVTILRASLQWNPSCTINAPDAIQYFTRDAHGRLSFKAPESTKSNNDWWMRKSDYDAMYSTPNITKQTLVFLSIEDMIAYEKKQLEEEAAKRAAIIAQAANNVHDEALLAILNEEDLDTLIGHPVFYPFRVDDSYTDD